MLKVDLHSYDSSGDPPARFATDAEIAIADQLRHELEERYLGAAAESSSSQAHWSGSDLFDPR